MVDNYFCTLEDFLHLCALKMRMEPLLFAHENASEWAFSKRKGVERKKTFKKIFKGVNYDFLYVFLYLLPDDIVGHILFLNLIFQNQFSK